MKRVRELDAIRGLGALVVMIYHLRPQAFALEGVRVDLFLVLSGYLITSIILTKGHSPGFYRLFLARRTIRILPSYYLCLGLMIAVNPFLPKPFPIDGLPYYLTFTQNIPRYWGAEPPPFNWYFFHTWSLALEQQFYLIWPLVLLAIGRKGLIPLTLAMTAASVVARTLGVHWWLLPARCDGLAIGSLIAALFFEGLHDPDRVNRLRMRLSFATFLAVTLIVWGLGTSPSWELGRVMDFRLSTVILGFNVLFGGLIGLVILSSGHPSLRILRDPRLAHLGKVSYGLYLYHSPVFIGIYMCGRWLRLGEPLWLEGVKLGTCVAVASLSWRYVEQPILSWREQFRFQGSIGDSPDAHQPGPHVSPAKGTVCQ